MKILVISLLRLGDILMSAPAIRSIRQQYPDAQIDLLVNSQFISVRTLLSDVDNVVPFDRLGLQDGLAEANCPLLEPIDYLTEITDHLCGQHYDLVVNLTQNRLSGYLSTLVQAKNQIGLSLNSTGQATYSSSWFRYLNDYVAAGTGMTFHYADLFRLAIGFNDKETEFEFQVSQHGVNEVNKVLSSSNLSDGKKVIVQALTSDSKKNLGRVKWAEAIAQFKNFEPDAHIILLGAPNEENELRALQADLAAQKVDCALAILTLDGALALLKQSDLLLTGDTSIKHLANGTEISILEISIGSSDYKKTGAYKADSLILKTNESCAPCGHSTTCHREQHYCSNNMPSELIALSASKLLHSDWAALKTLAEEYADCAEVIRTRETQLGIWYGQNLAQGSARLNIADILDAAAWKFYLDKEHLKPLAAYGSESLKIKESLASTESLTNDLQLKLYLEQIEKKTSSAESRLNKILSTLSKHTRISAHNGDHDFIEKDLRQEISSVESTLAFGNIFSDKMNLSNKTGLYELRQLQNALNQAFGHQHIKLKLINNLRNQLSENL